jgi:hypothetical protein
MAAALATIAALVGVLLGGFLQHFWTERREGAQRRYERERDFRDRRTDTYAEYFGAVSGWASLLVMKNQADVDGAIVERDRLDVLQREFEEGVLRPAQARFRLLAPTSLVDDARGVTDTLRRDMRHRIGGTGTFPDVSPEYTARYRAMMQMARDDLGTPES